VLACPQATLRCDVDSRILDRDLYSFTFFASREPGHRHLSKARALAAWSHLLRGRFRLLDRFLAYVEQHGQPAVTSDTWRQVLDFATNVKADLSNYDVMGAWPTLLDGFVFHLTQGRVVEMPATAADTLDAQWMAHWSPPAGVKRRLNAHEGPLEGTVGAQAGPAGAQGLGMDANGRWKPWDQPGWPAVTVGAAGAIGALDPRDSDQEITVATKRLRLSSGAT